jgi:hypothetical protein
MSIQNVVVEQRRMEAVTNGLIGGSVISLLLVVAGAVALTSNIWEFYYSPKIAFAWLSFLSALMLGQLYLTYSLVSTFSAAPVQTEKATVA